MRNLGGVAASPSFGKMFRRGLVRRCPWCGDRHAFFHAWLLKNDRCQRCGLRWDRGTDGQELGAVVINLILTVGIVLVGTALGMWAAYPEVPVVPLATGAIIGSCIAYAVVYPIGFTIYHAIDLAVRAPDAAELAEASDAVAAARVANA